MINVLDLEITNCPEETTVEYDGDKLIIKNSGSADVLLLVSLDCWSNEPYALFQFNAVANDGAAPFFYLTDHLNRILGEAYANSESACKLSWNGTRPDCIHACYKVFGQSEVTITCAQIEFLNNRNRVDNLLFEQLRGSLLIVAPDYPSDNNRYLCAFVHSRVKAYIDQGITCDVVCCWHSRASFCRWTYEGVSVLSCSFETLTYLLKRMHYETMCVHFFDNAFADVLRRNVSSSTHVFLWVHGTETLYWDWPSMASHYFEPKVKITKRQRKEFRERDIVVEEFSNKPNYTWVFVSDWIKKRSEELIGISFRNAVIIPNYIDAKTFAFKQKSSDLRKRVFTIRRFDNISKYVIDITMATILELSKRPFFDELSFEIYGMGDYWEQLTEPVREFKNVHLHRQLLTHSQIASAHEQCGIALFPTRYDAQGVSMCEAASSGLAVISSDCEVTRDFLLPELLAETENPKDYADLIESLFYDRKLFLELASKNSAKVLKKCCFEETVGREIELITAKHDDIAPESASIPFSAKFKMGMKRFGVRLNSRSK